MRPSSLKSAARDKRGAKARAEMLEKGYIQTCELAHKLTAELGRSITVSAIRGLHERGRIPGVLHKESNIWFYPADTKMPDKLTGKNFRKPVKLTGRNFRNPKQAAYEPVALGSWANWPAPGFVRIAMMGLKRNYQYPPPLFGRRDLGWLGGVI